MLQLTCPCAKGLLGESRGYTAKVTSDSSPPPVPYHPPLSHRPVPLGTTSASGSPNTTACAAGTYRDSSSTTCLPCADGFYASRAGKAVGKSFSRVLARLRVGLEVQERNGREGVDVDCIGSAVSPDSPQHGCRDAALAERAW